MSNFMNEIFLWLGFMLGVVGFIAFKIYKKEEPSIPSCFGKDNTDFEFYLRNRCDKCYWENCCNQIRKEEKDHVFQNE